MSKIVDKREYLLLIREINQSGRPSIGDLVLKESDLADIIHQYAEKQNIELIVGSNKNAVYVKDGLLMMQVMIKKKREEIIFPHKIHTGPMVAVVA